MEVLYSSKGISKAAATKKIISIIICVALMIGFFIFSESKVKGRTQNVSIGGQYTSITLDKYRFSSEERKAVAGIGMAFGIMAIFDAALLGLCRVSWTEICRDKIKGSFMGKTASYSTEDITNATVFGNYLILDGKFGKASLIVQDPKQARKVIDEILLNR